MQAPKESRTMSARIYQFPTKGSAAPGASREPSKSEANAIPPRAAKVVLGSNWYHDEAIQEAERHNNLHRFRPA
jgi:hypothetical protein